MQRGRVDTYRDTLRSEVPLHLIFSFNAVRGAMFGKTGARRADKHGAVDGLEGGAVDGAEERLEVATQPRRQRVALLMQEARLRVCKLLCTTPHTAFRHARGVPGWHM